jgi:hypothetical protein
MYNYIGVIIAVENYHNSPAIRKVKFALNDANEFRDSLIDLGCDPDRLKLLTDNVATKTTIKEEIKKVAKLATTQDVIVLYFAGHGLLHNGKNLLTCVDTSLTNIENTTVDLNFILSQFEKSASNKVIAFLDCCHSGIKFSEDERSTLSRFSTDQLQYDYHNAEHLTVFASCKDDEKSQSDVERSHGAWSYYLIEALRGNAGNIYDSGLLFSDNLQRYLADNTYQRVKKITVAKKNQTPVKFGKETVERFIVADVNTALQKKEVKPDDSLAPFESAVISTSDWDNVRTLPGFGSKHKEPKDIDSYHEKYIQKIAYDLLVEEIDSIAKLLKTDLRYKRKDIEEPVFEDGTGQITTTDFDYVVRVTQSTFKANRYVLTKSVENFKNSNILSKDEFNRIFGETFDELELSRNKKINVADVIDLIEEIDDEELVRVEYETSDTSRCKIYLNDVPGIIYITERSIKLVSEQKHSPRELILSFQQAYLKLNEQGVRALLE